MIFINSICGHKIFPEGKMVFYNASKLALTCVVEGWRREVQINLNFFVFINPYFMDRNFTNLVDNKLDIKPGFKPTWLKRYKAANIVNFLVSDNREWYYIFIFIFIFEIIKEYNNKIRLLLKLI